MCDVRAVSVWTDVQIHPYRHSSAHKHLCAGESWECGVCSQPKTAPRAVSCASPREVTQNFTDVPSDLKSWGYQLIPGIACGYWELRLALVSSRSSQMTPALQMLAKIPSEVANSSWETAVLGMFVLGHAGRGSCDPFLCKAHLHSCIKSEHVCKSSLVLRWKMIQNSELKFHKLIVLLTCPTWDVC